MWALSNMGDTGNGFLAAIAICQALYAREKTGRGQWVDTSIVNAQLLNTSYAIARPDGTGFERPMLDAMQLGFSAGVRLYETAEGWLCLSLVTDAHWHALGEALGEVDLQAGGKLATAAARKAADEDIAQRLERALSTRSAAAWQSVLDAAGVPCEVSSDTATMELWGRSRVARARADRAVPAPRGGGARPGGPGLRVLRYTGARAGPPFRRRRTHPGDPRLPRLRDRRSRSTDGVGGGWR